jgi:hypothetical protein
MSFANYIPALGEQFISLYKRKLKYKNFDMKFFTNESHFNYNYALQSMYYGINNAPIEDEINFRQLIGFGDDKILFTDSGGFQLATFKKSGKQCNINIVDSLRWQEKNGNIIMELDFPPNLDGNFSYDEFMWALKESEKNFRIFDENRQNFKVKLYNVIHGQNLDYMQLWYDTVKNFKTEGWAIGVKPAFDPLLQALCFMFLYEKGEFSKDSFYGLHFFGTSGRNVVPTIIYLASKLNNKFISYDSSSYNRGSIYRAYSLPFEMCEDLDFGEKFKISNPHIKTLPCMCPVCKSIDNMDILNTKEIFAGTLISLHNMYQYIQYNNLLNSLVVEKEKFITFLKSINISQRCLLSIEFVDFAFEYGVYNAYKKYEQNFDIQDITKSKQVSIFDF